MLMSYSEAMECAERCNACAAGRLTNNTMPWEKTINPSPTDIEDIFPSVVVPRYGEIA